MHALFLWLILNPCQGETKEKTAFSTCFPLCIPLGLSTSRLEVQYLKASKKGYNILKNYFEGALVCYEVLNMYFKA